MALRIFITIILIPSLFGYSDRVLGRKYRLELASVRPHFTGCYNIKNVHVKYFRKGNGKWSKKVFTSGKCTIYSNNRFF